MLDYREITNWSFWCSEPKPCKEEQI